MGIYILAGIIGVFLLVLILAYFIEWLHWFRKELRYLNNEISRTNGKEQRHYIKRRKKLLLSLIPFVRY